MWEAVCFLLGSVAGVQIDGRNIPSNQSRSYSLIWRHKILLMHLKEIIQRLPTFFTEIVWVHIVFKIKDDVCFCVCVECTSYMLSAYVCLHNGCRCSCCGGLRSWERHEAITQRWVPQGSRCSHSLVAWAAWLRHGCSTALSLFPVDFSVKVWRPSQSRSTPRPSKEYLKNS